MVQNQQRPASILRLMQLRLTVTEKKEAEALVSERRQQQHRLLFSVFPVDAAVLLLRWRG